MVFSSVFFIFIFFPLTLIVSYTLYILAAEKRRIHAINIFLLLMSLLFYAWGEPLYVLLMIASICFNYYIGLKIERAPSGAKAWLVVSVVVNISLLIVFKYLSMMIGLVNFINPFALAGFPQPHLALPIGISFYTFQAMSYTIDVYRKQTRAQRNLLDMGLYITFFPQLIAGPIVRYHDIALQLKERLINKENVYAGMQRFIIGLGKKVLIANTMAQAADQIFALGGNELSTPLAWVGIIAYSFQIYFDFSGYSDMAIGLGRIFGFHFLENFNYPYTATSVRDFWHRWHISLSTWFRDYLYIPLGGSRGGVIRTNFNQVLVFFLCGLWHGASWNFALWGLFHGFFLTIERLFLGKVLNRLPRAIGFCYTSLVVLCGWVLFRAESFSQSGSYFKALFGFTSISNDLIYKFVDDREMIVTVLIAVVGATPLLKKYFLKFDQKNYQWAVSLFLAIVFFLSIMYLSAGTYNPFIYFRF